MQVLIIEDEKPLANALFAKCVEEGLSPSLAGDGREGLAKALEAKPDLIMLDLVMPHMDGVQFLHELRKNTWGKSVPVIVLTNLSADSEQLVKAMVEGSPEYYLVKSDWKISDIVAKVWETLGGKK